MVQFLICYLYFLLNGRHSLSDIFVSEILSICHIQGSHSHKYRSVYGYNWGNRPKLRSYNAFLSFLKSGSSNNVKLAILYLMCRWSEQLGICPIINQSHRSITHIWTCFLFYHFRDGHDMNILKNIDMIFTKSYLPGICDAGL